MFFVYKILDFGCLFGSLISEGSIMRFKLLMEQESAKKKIQKIGYLLQKILSSEHKNQIFIFSVCQHFYVAQTL